MVVRLWCDCNVISEVVLWCCGDGGGNVVIVVMLSWYD